MSERALHEAAEAAGRSFAELVRVYAQAHIAAAESLTTEQAAWVDAYMAANPEMGWLDALAALDKVQP